ncbi:MAG: nucleotidyltransferase domain-containing protein [Brevinematales bacterium]|nr:nucleotidyltransferase domain-containing protein [Brevinematales bacterium]
MSENLQNILQEIASFIKQHFKAQKVILFGSYASGNPTKDSDIDFLVIMKTNKRFPVEAANIKGYIHKRDRAMKELTKEWITNEQEAEESFEICKQVRTIVQRILWHGEKGVRKRSFSFLRKR